MRRPTISMLELKNLTKDFFPPFTPKQLFLSFGKPAQRTRALDNASFTLPKGSSLAILGPNGAGKTTLLKIISTLILPDKGSVKVNGWSLGNDDDRIRACVGLVASCERSFYWRLTGRQNLEFFCAMYGLYGRHARIRIEELLKLFKIDYQDKRFDSYSTGMQQKFALLRAMLHDPGLLLLDEPTKSLDYTAARDLRNFIKEHLVKEQKKTVIFTTHHMDEAMDFADLFMILDHGRTIAFGTLEDLRSLVKKPAAALADIFVQLTSEESL
jgi:ABC-2 type transport system ATP-binding protein